MKTEAQKTANKKYLEKFEEIKIRVPKGMKAEIKYLAERNNLSVQKFIIGLIELARCEDELQKIEEEKQDRIDRENDICEEELPRIEEYKNKEV